MYRYRQLLPYVLAHWRRLLVIALFTVLSSAVAALQPWPLKIIVDYGLSQTERPLWLNATLEQVGLTTSAGVWLGLGAVAALLVFALSTLVETVLTWSWTMAGQRMVGSVAQDMFGRLLHFPLRLHQSRPVGDSLSRLTGDCWCVYKLTDGVVISPLQKVITVLTLGIIAWQLHAQLALCALITAPLMGVATVYFGRRIRRRARQGREAQARLLNFVHQTLSSIPIVQAFGTESSNRQRYEDLATEAVGLSQRGSLQTSAYRFVTGLITAIGLAVILFIGGRQVLAGTLSLGSFLVFLAYMRTLQNSAEGLVRLYSTLKPVEASMDRVLEILETKPDETPESPYPLPWPVRSSSGASLCFDGVTFGYEPGRPVLEAITLHVDPGQVLALAGRAGAGKTTLVSLIPRLFDPWQGQVLINGTDIRQLRLQELRSHVAVVGQETFLLPLTVAENIAYGRPKATRLEIETAARLACADDFIRRLPEGYETVLAERGATLSGGERQRLAIARAFLLDAPILILDEPTSALDGQTEAELLRALEQLKRGRTVIVIAHRLSTIRAADEILVMEGGRIVQRGRHADLVLAGGTYEELHTLQSTPHRREAVTA